MSHYCITKKKYQTLKKRIFRRTRKRLNRKQVRHIIESEPEKYLNVDELHTHRCAKSLDADSALLKSAKHLSLNHSKMFLQPKFAKRMEELHKLRKACLTTIGSSNIERQRKHLHSAHQAHKHQDLLDIDIEYYLYKEMGKQYDNYRVCHFCKHYDVLQLDKLAKHFDFLDVKSFTYNPSKTYYSFCIDFIGNRNYHFFVKDVINGELKHIPLHKEGESFVSVHQTLQRHLIPKQMSENYVWIDDETFLYIANNKFYNTSSCYTYHLKKKKRKLIYSCQEHRELNLHGTYGGFYVILMVSSYHSDEMYLIDIQDHKSKHYKTAKCIVSPVLKDAPFVQYPFVEHIDATWYILRDDRGVYTFMKTMDFCSFETLFIKNTKGLFVYDVYYMNDTFVFFSRVKSASQIFLYHNCINKLKKITLDMCDVRNSCHVEAMNFIPEQNKLYFHSSSFTNQNRLFCLEMDKAQHSQVEEVVVPGKRGIRGNGMGKYEEKVVYLKNHTIQLTLLHKKGLSLKNCKCLLYGYGAYGDHYDAVFNASKLLTLCDMGFLVVIAHISGDRTLGFDQRRAGMLLNKKNTFVDFIYIIKHYLFKKGITSRDKLAIWGRSAGGLLIGAVLNMCPDICAVAVLGVPFISPFLTMQNHKNPLAFESHSEWGNPLKQPNADYIESYSPYQNIQPNGDYPHMFIYSNLNDTLVPYTEPYMYYKSLKKEVGVFREEKKDLLLHIEDKFGHMQGSSEKDKTRQYALIFAFLDKYI